MEWLPSRVRDAFETSCSVGLDFASDKAVLIVELTDQFRFNRLRVLLEDLSSSLRLPNLSTYRIIYKPGILQIGFEQMIHYKVKQTCQRMPPDSSIKNPCLLQLTSQQTRGEC